MQYHTAYMLMATQMAAEPIAGNIILIFADLLDISSQHSEVGRGRGMIEGPTQPKWSEERVEAAAGCHRTVASAVTAIA